MKKFLFVFLFLVANIAYADRWGDVSPNTTVFVETAIASKTTDYTLVASDYTINATAATVPTVITVPTAVGVSGKRYLVFKRDSTPFPIVLRSTGSETVGGLKNYGFHTQNEGIEIQSDGTNWLVVGHPGAPFGYIPPLRGMVVKNLTINTIAGSNGISGASYNENTGRVQLDDNNAVNVKEYNPNTPSVIYRTWTLSGFTDNEAAKFMYYDAANQRSLNAIMEEQTNRLSTCWVDETITNQTLTRTTVGVCPTSTVLTVNGGGNIWTPDVSNGAEGMAYDQDQDVFYVCKQRTNLELFKCPRSGTDCTEPFDMQAVLGGVITECNDLSYFSPNKSLYIVSNASDRILEINPETGAILENVPLSVWAPGFSQEEGFHRSQDGLNAWLTSETGSYAWLAFAGDTSPIIQSGPGIITQTTANDQMRLDVGGDGTTVPLRLINDVNGFGDSDADDNTKTELKLEFYDSNELITSQTESGRCILSAVTPPSALGAVQQESGGECEIISVLGTGTHGVNSRVVNMHYWNSGRVGVQQGAASTSRGAVWANLGGVIFFSTTQVGNSAGAETNLFSTTVEGNTLNVDGSSIAFESGGTFGAGASADKRVRAYFGATTIFDSGAQSLTTADWKLECQIWRTGAATQKALCSFETDNAAILSDVDYSTPAETLSGNVTLRGTGSGTNASDIVGEVHKAFYWPEQ